MIYTHKINKFITLCFILFLTPSSKAAETIYLYQGTLSRTVEVKSLIEFSRTKIPNKELKSIIKITNQNEEEFLKALSYEIDIPINISSKLMNSKIGEVLIGRITNIVKPNKIFNKEISVKAIRSAILLSAYKNNEKITIIDFFKAYPNKNVAINLKALNKTLKKVESLTDLIEFYSNSPFQKLKDGSSSI